MSGRLKSLAADTVIYGAFTIIARFLTFLLTPLHSNFMTINEVGDIQNITAIFAFMMILYSFGMESAYFRFYEKNDIEKSKAAYSNSLLFILFTCLASSIALLSFKSFFSGIVFTSNYDDVIYYSAVLIPSTDAFMLVPYAYFRMSNQARKFAVVKVLVVVIAVVLNYVLLVEYNMGLKGVIFAQLAANIGGIIFMSFSIFKNLKFRIDKTLLLDMMKFGVPTVPASFSQIILQLSDRPIITYLRGSAEAGLYGVNYRLGIPMMLFVSLFEYAWKPFYLSHYQDTDAKQLFSRIFTYFTFICGFVFLGTGLFITDIVKLPFVGGTFINPQYWSGMYIIPIILAAYYFNGAFNNFACGLQIMKKTQYFPLAVMSSAALNVGLNLLLVPNFGYEAAAWTTLAAYLLSAVIIYYVSQKIYPIKYEWSRIILIISLVIGLYFSVFYLCELFPLWLSLAVKSISIIAFVLFLKLFGFFTQSEISQIKQLFRRR